MRLLNGPYLRALCSPNGSFLPPVRFVSNVEVVNCWEKIAMGRELLALLLFLRERRGSSHSWVGCIVNIQFFI